MRLRLPALIVLLTLACPAQETQTLRVPGLEQPVEILRDKWGVAHIYAKNQHDLFFAQGYNAAGDRLFQMELWKRAGQGRLAEIIGPAAVRRDNNARLLRYRGPMEAEYSSYAPDAKDILEAFTSGINAYIDNLKGDYPQEFKLAGFAPEHWRPEDCLSRNAAFFMTSNAGQELYDAQLVRALGPEKAANLLPLDPRVKLEAFPGADYSGLSPALLEEIVSSDKRIELAPQESNNWTVAGRLTASGHALLANDPHRTIALPSLRYIVHLVAPGWNVIGSGEPALPGVAIGHNQHIAWGLTIFGIDQQDLFLETLSSKDPLLYKTTSGWRRMSVVHETIRVKGAADVDAALAFTEHGPVIWQDTASRRALSLRWVGAEPGSAGYLASLSLDRAEDWQQFRKALERWKLPSENFVYADSEGNIGEQSAGAAPIRSPEWTGLLPVPGDRHYSWRGWRPLDELPHSFNPPAGFIATANHKMIAADETHPVSFTWDADFRFRRISEVLAHARNSGRKLTREDFGALQSDVLSIPARELMALLRGASLPDDDAAAAAKMLLRWDCRLEANSAAAALYEVWFAELRREVIHKAAPEALWPAVEAWFSPQMAAESLRHPRAEIFGNPPQAGRDALFASTLASAWHYLAGVQGGDAEQWEWGKMHTVTFRHPLDKLPGTSGWDLGPLARPGDDRTVNSTEGSDWKQNVGASYREILDPGEWDDSLAVNTPGQSGEPGSAHYADLLPLWYRGEYFPLLYSRAAIEKAATTLRLEPK